MRSVADVGLAIRTDPVSVDLVASDFAFSAAYVCPAGLAENNRGRQTYSENRDTASNDDSLSDLHVACDTGNGNGL